MKSILHYGSCPTWETADFADCSCYSTVWRIRKEPAELFPWRIWQRTTDLDYEPLMRCSSFENARQMVTALMILRHRVTPTRSADV